MPAQEFPGIEPAPMPSLLETAMAKPTPLTPKQTLVLEALRQAHEPLSAYALLDRLRARGFTAAVQVYRALKHLVGRGLAHRLETMNAYVSCAYRDGCGRGFAVFMICDRCGHISEFRDVMLSARLDGWSGRNGFRLSSATIEMHGACSACTDDAGCGQR